MAKDSILSPKTGNKTRMSTPTSSLQYFKRGPSQCNRTRSEKATDLNEISETISICIKYDFFH